MIEKTHGGSVSGSILIIAFGMTMLLLVGGTGAAALTVDDNGMTQAFVEALAKDTWNYSKTFNENHFPLNWYRLDNNESGRYFNPAEVGFYALSPILAYDMQLDCDGDSKFDLQLDWNCSVSKTSNTLNRIESLPTYQSNTKKAYYQLTFKRFNTFGPMIFLNRQFF